MAVSAVITCPACKKKFKGREELEGKKIRCPACSHAFIVKGVAVDKPGSSPKTAAASPPPEAKTQAKPKRVLWDEEEDDPNPYEVTTLDIAPRCPHCANLMESEDAVICLHCGYNTQTRQLPQVVKTVEHTGGERFLWLLPGILSVVGILICTIFLLFDDLELPKMIRDSWMEKLMDNEPWRVWTTIILLFPVWFMGQFAYKRLILRPVPPEKFKD